MKITDRLKMCEGKRRRKSKMVWYRNSCHTWKWCCVDHAPCDFSDYHTLRVGGLVFAGVIVFLSIILLAGKSTTTSCVGYVREKFNLVQEVKTQNRVKQKKCEHGWDSIIQHVAVKSGWMQTKVPLKPFSVTGGAEMYLLLPSQTSVSVIVVIRGALFGRKAQQFCAFQKNETLNLLFFLSKGNKITNCGKSKVRKQTADIKYIFIVTPAGHTNY